MTRLAVRWLLAIVLIWAPALYGAPIMLVTTMTGAQEFPPNASPGFGTAVVVIDPVAHTMSVHAVFEGLTVGNTAAHIHCCVDPPGTVGVATATPTFPGFPTGATAGTYDAVFDTLDAGTYRAGFITAAGGTTALAEAVLFAGLLTGQAYFNIHTSNFPGGEIRGFLQIPEPASLALLGVAMLAACVVRRRRL
jgi:hypothetical protein